MLLGFRSVTPSLPAVLLAGAWQLIPHYESRAAAFSLNNDITVFVFVLHCSTQASADAPPARTELQSSVELIEICSAPYSVAVPSCTRPK
jgi:hypothetical protein